MNFQDVIKDKDFLGLKVSEKLKVLQTVDNDFASLPIGEQRKVVMKIQSSAFPMKSAHETEKPSSWKQSLSDAAHTILPAAGGMAGTGLALAVGNTPLTVAVPDEVFTIPPFGAAGTALGEQGADAIDQLLGIVPPKTMLEAATEAAGNIYEGAKGEALGLGIAAPVQAISKATPKAVKAVREVLSSNPDAVAATQRLQQEIPGYKTTYGMATENKDMLGIERAFIESQSTPGVKQQAQDMLAGNKQAISDRMRTLSGGNVDDYTEEVSKQVQRADNTRAGINVNQVDAGENVRTAISDAQKPVKAAMNDLRDKIPDYPMSGETVDNTFEEILSTKTLSDQARQEVSALKNFWDNRKKNLTTHEIFGFDKTLGDMYDRVSPSAQRSIMQIKEAIRNDLNLFSQQVRSGEVKQFNGKIYRPSELSKQIEESEIAIAKEQAKSTPDIAAMEAKLRDARIPTGKVTGEGEEQYLKRISKDYERNFGEIPMTGGNQKVIENLSAGSKSAQELLSKLEPGQDVAAIIRAYNNYAHESFFKRFDTQAVNKAMDKTRLPENVTAIFTTPSNVKDLYKAIGKENGKDAVRAFYMASFGDLLAKNPENKALFQWFHKNKNVLNVAGLSKEFNKLIDEQAGYNLANKLLSTDSPKDLFATLLQGNMRQQKIAIGKALSKINHNPRAVNGLRQAFMEYLDEQTTSVLAAGKEGFKGYQKTLKQLDPTMKTLLTKKQYDSVMTLRDAVNKTQLLTASTLGGSQTYELGANRGAQRILKDTGVGTVKGNLFDLLASTGVGGLVNVALGPAAGITSAAATRPMFKALRESMAKYGDNAVRKVFARAMFDPDYAQAIIQASNGNFNPFKSLLSYQTGRTGAIALDRQSTQEGASPAQ